MCLFCLDVRVYVRSFDCMYVFVYLSVCMYVSFFLMIKRLFVCSFACVYICMYVYLLIHLCSNHSKSQTVKMASPNPLTSDSDSWFP